MLDLHDAAGEVLKAIGAALGATAFQYAKRLYKDLNALFGKIRLLEARVKTLETQEALHLFKPSEASISTGNSTRS